VCEYEKREEEKVVEHYIRITNMFEERRLSYNERAEIMKRVYTKSADLDAETSFEMNSY
jgi:hypothetical protein